MAYIRKVPCSKPGCKNYCVAGSNYCSEHQRPKIEQGSRNTTSEWKNMYGAKWRKARENFLLQPENHYCVECMKRGCYTPATEVDHIVPHKGDNKLFWDRKNWQALCKPCHSAKTMRENKEKEKQEK